jgi:hypothetical protein
MKLLLLNDFQILLWETACNEILVWSVFRRDSFIKADGHIVSVLQRSHSRCKQCL